ncbi:MAG TPA: signal recognition particle-docking protein FtsY [Candidatus Dependentiae bacterium]|nr:signal recognition particle-docking protein FtsY [Candidatus Dependentiae bacterium]
MFNFIKKALHKIYDTCTSKFTELFSKNTINQETLTELEKILIQADTGVATTKYIIQNLKDQYTKGTIHDSQTLKQSLQNELLKLLERPITQKPSSIILLVGINGSGKTTLASKIAYKMQQEGKKVLLVAADTYRAAAQEQLATWAQNLNVDIVQGTYQQDPASVVYKGCAEYKNGRHDTIIIDTAGRLQTKVNLMKELEKIKRVIAQQLPDQHVNTILTVDAMLGQNSLEQARIFHESTQLDGIALTKMDGTGKGGIVFAIAHELNIPVLYVSFGEQPDQLKLFSSNDYVQELLNG